MDPETGESHFDLSGNPNIHVVGPLKRLETEELVVSGIQAPIGDDLEIKSDAKLDVEAAEGVEILAKEVNMEAASEITFAAGNEGILNEYAESLVYIKLDDMLSVKANTGFDI